MNRHFVHCLALLATLAIPSSGVISQWLPTYGTEGQIVKCFAIKDSVIFAGAYGGIYIPGDTVHYYGGAFRSTDGGTNWAPINNGLTSGTVYSLRVFALAVSGGYLIAGTSNGIFRSSDDGTSWAASNSGIFVADGWCRTLLLKGPYIYAGFDGLGVFRSSDHGASWHPAYTGMTNYRVYSFCAMDSILFAGTWLGYIFRSTDEGLTWASPDSTTRQTVALAANGPDILAGQSFGGILLSKDQGTSWARRDSGLTSEIVHALLVTGNTLFAGLETGVFRSTDSAVSWSTVNEGLGGRAVWSFGLSSQYFFVGTDDLVYRRPISELITSAPDLHTEFCTEFVLEQNYPNPFNPVTTIGFYLPQRLHTRLIVFNVIGQLVAELLDREAGPGYHEITFDGSRLASGVYFYRLQAREFARTKSFLLIH